MKKLLIIVLGIAVCVWLPGDIWARGGRGGGGGGGRGGGGARGGGGGRVSSGGARGGGGYGGGSRSVASRTPSMSRPSSSSVRRPTTSTGNRVASTRPSMGTLPTPGNRPNAGLGNRPGTGNIANRPGNLPATGNRPGTGTRPGAGTLPSGGAGHPSRNDLANFLDLPNAGGGNVGSGRPTSGLGNAAAGFGGVLAGGAAAEFLRNRPDNALPGGIGQAGAGNIASTLPTRPGGEGTGPGGGQADLGRPGQPGNRPDNSLPGNRPDVGRPGTPGNRPGDVGLPGQPGNRPDLGLPGRPDLGRPGQPGNRIQNLPSRITDNGQWQNWRQEHRGEIGDWWQNHGGDYGDWFGDRWWNDNHINWPYYPGFGYWAWAAWAPLAGWVDYGWTDPVYYNYGENVYYEDGSVYYGDQPVCTEAKYIQQAEAIVMSAPETAPAEKDWLPLGVFAITQDGEPTGADPTMFLQLAVSKQGVINGTFQNTATNTVKAVEGMVDKQTQRAAWTAKDELRPLMEVGIVNLTQDSTSALIHFPDNSTQRALLVRLEKPGAAKKTETTK